MRVNLNPYEYFKKASFWSRTKTSYFGYERDSFGKMKNELHRLIGEQKIFGKNVYTTYTPYDSCKSSIACTDKFLVFGELYCDLSVEEYESAMDIMEKGKEDFCKKQLVKQLKKIHINDKKSFIPHFSSQKQRIYTQ